MKAMLRAPEALSSGVAGAEAVEVVPMNSQTQELLPGGLVEGKELPILDSVGQERVYVHGRNQQRQALQTKEIAWRFLLPPPSDRKFAQMEFDAL